jgi:Domain of unknown function (DUF5122) beta-propeller
VLLQPDGNVVIGGTFRTVNGVLRPNIARLFGDLTAPSLRISQSNGGVIISWPSTWTGFTLRQNTNLNGANWIHSLEAVTDDGTNRFITVNPPTGRRFYRLFKP